MDTLPKELRSLIISHIDFRSAYLVSEEFSTCALNNFKTQLVNSRADTDDGVITWEFYPIKVRLSRSDCDFDVIKVKTPSWAIKWEYDINFGGIMQFNYESMEPACVYMKKIVENIKSIMSFVGLNTLLIPYIYDSCACAVCIDNKCYDSYDLTPQILDMEWVGDEANESFEYRIRFIADDRKEHFGTVSFTPSNGKYPWSRIYDVTDYERPEYPSRDDKHVFNGNYQYLLTIMAQNVKRY